MKVKLFWSAITIFGLLVMLSGVALAQRQVSSKLKDEVKQAQKEEICKV